ncbi:MAG: hypothetical protein LBU69_01670 [Deltaproteobacteria bacterium]|nr:hypothetical protein [Deltaproteobacteria bacterium]
MCQGQGHKARHGKGILDRDEKGPRLTELCAAGTLGLARPQKGRQGRRPGPKVHEIKLVAGVGLAWGCLGGLKVTLGGHAAPRAFARHLIAG